MKKFTVLILLLFLSLSLFGCGTEDTSCDYYAAKMNTTSVIEVETNITKSTIIIYSSSKNLEKVEINSIGDSTNIKEIVDINESFQTTPNEKYKKIFYIDLSLVNKEQEAEITTINFTYLDEIKELNIGKASFVHLSEDNCVKAPFTLLSIIQSAISMPTNRDYVPLTISVKKDGLKLKEITSNNDAISFTPVVRDSKGNIVQDNIMYADNQYFIDMHYNADYVDNQDAAIFLYKIFFEYGNENYYSCQYLYDIEYQTIDTFIDNTLNEINASESE